MATNEYRRSWIKLWVHECINGSLRYQLDPAERGTWYDLLVFAAQCATPGTICDRDGRPYPREFIANRLNIPLELLKRTLEKCEEEGRVHNDEFGIHIANWNRYQSEYQRQKRYRSSKSKKEQEGFFDLYGKD